MPHQFNSRCDGCSACVRQCPTKAIYGEFKVRYRIDAAQCIDCGVCGEICPIEAVVDQYGRLAQRVPRNLRTRPTIDLDVCNGCALCVDYCPFDCLTVVGGTHSGICVLTEPHACTSCGECADICLKGAVRMTKHDLQQHDPAEKLAEAEAYGCYLDSD